MTDILRNKKFRKNLFFRKTSAILLFFNIIIYIVIITHIIMTICDRGGGSLKKLNLWWRH